MRARLAAIWVIAAVVLAMMPACRRNDRLQAEPRYASVRNALSALGLVQSGPILRGTLREAQDNRVRLAIGSECTTVIAFGGDDIGDLDISLHDADDQVVAKDTTSDPQATLRVCAVAPGNYTLVIRAAHGSGDYLASLWTGKGGSGAGPHAPGESEGTCDSPTPLSPGTLVSSTSRGNSNETSSCGVTDGKEIVYQFSLSERKRVTVELESQFESVLSIRRDDCDSQREVACREATGRDLAKKVRFDSVLETGIYYVVVDGSESDAGSFRLSLETTKAPELAVVCRDAPALGSHHTIENWQSRVDLARGTCGASNGPEATYRLDVAQRTRVRIKHHYEAGGATIHLRKNCVDPQSEVGCSDNGTRENEASYVGMLGPGRYIVFADTAQGEIVPTSEVSYESQPEAGRGTPEDTCSGALPLNVGETIADTFDAVADVAMRCVPTATPDVFYRLSVPSRMHVVIRAVRSEAPHILGLYKSCGTQPGLLECGGVIDAVVPAGTYFVGIHGATPTSFGEIAVQTQLEDVTARENACKAASSMRVGQTVKGNTKGATPIFGTRCFGGTSPDRVHRLTLDKASSVEFILRTTGFRGLVSIRQSCLDSGDLNGEIGCNVERGSGSGELHHRMNLAAGSYFVVVSGAQSGGEGAYTLQTIVSTATTAIEPTD